MADACAGAERSLQWYGERGIQQQRATSLVCAARHMESQAGEPVTCFSRSHAA